MKLKLRRKALEKIKRREEEFDEEIDYRDGGKGMIAWCNDYVCVPIYPPGSDIPVWTPLSALPEEKNPRTGKSYAGMWRKQQRILKQCLKMENGRFVYRQIVFCWMRGEGKSLVVCLIQLWKFFNWPEQEITLGANSRDQIKFVHYDIIADIIRNSPDLNSVVKDKDIREKEIRMRDWRGRIRSRIRSISSFSGIVSNITGYTFSEIFDMKNPKFYTQLDGSIRTIPNALGIIDSTVSDKLHVLYQLYQGFITGKTKLVYFSYRYSEEGKMEDYWNPNMDDDQLRDYEVKFPFGEYERYFLNLWSAGVKQVFTAEMVEEIGYIGVDDLLLNHLEVQKVLVKKNEVQQSIGDLGERGKGFEGIVEEVQLRVENLYMRLKPVENIYSLVDEFGAQRMATIEDLYKLSEVFDTDFAILAGVDFGDPYATRGYARTILTVCAKGLPGSRSKPFAFVTPETAPKYIYFLLHLVNVSDHSLNVVKKELERAHEEFGGLDTFCSERYGAWDIGEWCEERSIKFEPIFPTYDKQKEAFKIELEIVRDGLFKAPAVGVQGSKSDDVLREEFPVFNHDSGKRWFGSTEKLQKYGVQDDFMFSSAWCFYGGRMLGIDNFRERKGIVSFGAYVPAEDLLGNYG